MSSPAVSVDPDQVGRRLQIIVAALISGQIVFGVVVVMIRGEQPARFGPISMFAAGVAALNVVVSLVMPRLAVSAQMQRLRKSEGSQARPILAALYQTKVILANAILEGAGMFNVVAYLVDGHWISLAIMFVLVCLMAVTFPSQTQFNDWAEQVQRETS